MKKVMYVAVTPKGIAVSSDEDFPLVVAGLAYAAVHTAHILGMSGREFLAQTRTECEKIIDDNDKITLVGESAVATIKVGVSSSPKRRGLQFSVNGRADVIAKCVQAAIVFLSENIYSEAEEPEAGHMSGEEAKAALGHILWLIDKNVGAILERDEEFHRSDIINGMVSLKHEEYEEEPRDEAEDKAVSVSLYIETEEAREELREYLDDVFGPQADLHLLSDDDDGDDEDDEEDE